MMARVRTMVAAFIGLSLVLTAIAVREGVPYRFGGTGSVDRVAADAVIHGTGLSAPIVFLVVLGVLLALTWLPGRWKAAPFFLLAAGAALGLAAGLAEIPMGSGPFVHDIGLLGVLIWGASLGVALALVIAAVLAGIAALRRQADESDG